jgi:hypothetical protein
MVPASEACRLGGVLPLFSSILRGSRADGTRLPPALFAYFKSSLFLCAFVLCCAALLLLPSPALAQYTQQAKLPASSPIGTPNAGYSVALSANGNHAIMGGYNDNSAVGAVWYATRSNGVWSAVGKYPGNTFAEGNEAGAAGLGNSVSMSADGATWLAGGPYDSSNTGAAWVFFSNPAAKLVGTGAVGAAQQGTSVAMSGDGSTVIVGGPYDNSNAGAAWIFTVSGGVWSQQGAKLVGSGAVGAAFQGYSVALSNDGNTAIVGGPLDNSNAGAAWVFIRSGGVWTQQAKLVGGGGTSVALSSDGDTAIVGGGAATAVFTRSGSVWSQQGGGLAGGALVALSADGNTAAVGKIIYARNGGVWTQQGAALANGGWSVALSSNGSTVLEGDISDSGNAGAMWVYAAVPTITSVTPNSGSLNGGTGVTIGGYEFTGATAVSFGGSAATNVVVVNSNTITATTSAHAAGIVDVTVTNPSDAITTGTGTGAYTYVLNTSTTSVGSAPNPSAQGQSVTFTATVSASPVAPTGSVIFKDGASAFGAGTLSSGTATFSTDSLAPGTHSITAFYAGDANSNVSTSSGLTQTVNSAAPTVTSVSPSNGPAAGGRIVTITGTNFTGSTAVSFGGSSAIWFNVGSATSILAKSPAGTGTVDVIVTTPDGTSATGAADQFTYVSAPTVTVVSPNSGPTAGGTGVTITGTNLTGATAVSFGAVAATNVTVVSGTSITATSPAGSAGAVDVTVTTAGGTSATGAADKFTYNIPSRTWVSAATGSDSNPCTLASPCLMFAAALTNTTAGGEIDVLTPGDYGPVTITKAISIYNDGAGTAGALTTSGTSGITVNAGANDAVNLRGLSFNGLTASGASGVDFIAGAQLHIEKCTFQGFATSGVTFAPGGGSAATAAMVIEDASLINNGTGLSIRPTGGIAANVALRRLKLDKNISGGLSVDGTDGGGAINAVLSDSSASLNSGNGITATGGPNGVTLNMMRVVAASNGAVGIQSSQSDGGTATVTVGESTVYGNAVGVQSLDGGALLSYATTQLTGNASNGSFTGNASLQ